MNFGVPQPSGCDQHNPKILKREKKKGKTGSLAVLSSSASGALKRRRVVVLVTALLY